MTPKAWTTLELKVLQQYAGLGSRVVAMLLDRSVSSVEHQARQQKVSLVKTDADFDAQKLGHQILERVRDVPYLQICPLCGQRFAVMVKTGMCRVCHLDQLVVLRETQLLELARERKLTKLRQDKRRLKVCDVCARPFFPRLGSDVTVCQECAGLV